MRVSTTGYDLLFIYNAILDANADQRVMVQLITAVISDWFMASTMCSYHCEKIPFQDCTYVDKYVFMKAG